MINGSVNVLSWLYAMYALPTRGNYELWAPLLRSVVQGLFRRQQYRGLRREVVLSYFLARWCLIWIWFNFTGQPRTVQEYVRVGVQGPAYLGIRPADGLSVEFERWATKCRIASVECSLKRFPPLLERLIYSNSRVHGNKTLYAEAGSYHYKLLLLNCMVSGLLPRRRVKEGTRRHC